MPEKFLGFDGTTGLLRNRWRESPVEAGEVVILYLQCRTDAKLELFRVHVKQLRGGGSGDFGCARETGFFVEVHVVMFQIFTPSGYRIPYVRGAPSRPQHGWKKSVRLAMFIQAIDKKRYQISFLFNVG